MMMVWMLVLGVRVRRMEIEMDNATVNDLRMNSNGCEKHKQMMVVGAPVAQLVLCSSGGILFV